MLYYRDRYSCVSEISKGQNICQNTYQNIVYIHISHKTCQIEYRNLCHYHCVEIWAICEENISATLHCQSIFSLNFGILSGCMSEYTSGFISYTCWVWSKCFYHRADHRTPTVICRGCKSRRLKAWVAHSQHVPCFSWIDMSCLLDIEEEITVGCLHIIQVSVRDQNMSVRSQIC